MSSWPPGLGAAVDRVVDGLSVRLGGARSSRRSFLGQVAVLGSAIATHPVDYVLRPQSAHATACGTLTECGDPFTAFCCTINHGANLCPPDTYVGGWWKADRSAYCRGAARYYVDCNGVAGSGWRCHCSGSHTCDRRKVACNVFRYGNCNTDVATNDTAVVCRVVTCTPPWEWDPACNETAFVDQATGSQSAPCLPGPWPSVIVEKWSDLGGPGGPLGDRTSPELRLPEGDGTWEEFEHGAIYDVAWAGVFGVVGPIFSAVAGRIGRAGIGFPARDAVQLDAGIGWQQPFVNRRDGRQGIDAEVVGRRDLGTHVLVGPVLGKWRALGGADGRAGYPTTSCVPTADGVGSFAEFLRVRSGLPAIPGAIYEHPALGVHLVDGAVLAKWRELGGEAGPLGLPATDAEPLGPKGAVASGFAALAGGVVASRGVVTSVPGIGTAAVWGPIYTRWASLDAQRGPLGVPRSDVAATPDGGGTMATFTPFGGPSETTGGAVVSSGSGTWAVLGSFSVTWIDDERGARVLGLPVGPEVLTQVSGTTLRSQPFATGTIYSSPLGADCVLYGPILDAYDATYGGPTGSLGLPTSSVRAESGGVEVATFQYGTLTYTPGVGVARS